MQVADLEVFRNVPFLLWVKDERGRYIWGNRTINQLANEDVVGKTDRDLAWANNADALQTNDNRVFETGEPDFQHEYIDKSSRGKATLSICKWLGKLDGEKSCFGISFIIE